MNAELDTEGQNVGDLFEEYGDLIYTLGLRICGSPENAEDLVQETFLRALKSWDSFEGRSKPSTWLFTIASRACGRMQRKRAGEPKRLDSFERLLPSGDEGIVQVPSGDDPSETAARNEAVGAILTAVTELPEEFRIPFVLKEVVDLSIAEISAALGVKEATIKTRLHRARLKIRQAAAACLPQKDGPPPDQRREECLALLKGKQEAMDRNVEFAVPQSHICERCRGVLDTLDFSRDTCRTMAEGTMPAELRAWIARELEAGSGSGGPV